MRKLNIRLWTRRLTLTAREAPAEMLLALYFFAIYSLNREHALSGMADYLPLMPIFFALSLLTNRWCRSPRSRIVYRLSPLAAVPFLWADVGGWVHSVAYPVTLIVSALTVFAGGWQRDNARFVERVLRYLSDAIASGLIALAAFLASCAIFFSIVYIFNILDDCSRGFTEYAAMASLLVVWPVLFLILDRDSERDQGNGFASGPFLDVLSNYILTPALLIYTAILYLYFAKIAIGWSLPKGGIAYLVFGYTITALVVQASQTLLQRRRYDWYYRRFGPIALPALAMFWIGVLYRVHQYGFTEARAYLVVCGTVMTLTVLMQDGTHHAQTGNAFPNDAEYAIKFIKKASGRIGGKEVAIEAKESSIASLQKQLDKTTDETKRQGLQEQIIAQELGIQSIYQDDGGEDGLYTLMRKAV